MRIAQIAPIAERIPPVKYGGTERVVYELTNELVKRGHKVTLFASGDSITKAKLVSVFPRSLRSAKIKDPYGLNEWTVFNIGLAYDMQNEFDIIHDHNGFMGFPAANLATTPTVITLHGPVTSAQRKMFEKLKKPNIATVSKAQLPNSEKVNYAGTVHHGLTMNNYPYSKTNDGYLLFVGRLSLEKGVHNAILVSQNLDIPLIIAAKLDSQERPYYEEYIEPYLSDDRIQWIGEVAEDERNKLMSRALCMLHPVLFKEPFGLTLIEALACGCPVIAFNRGSIPEIIQDKQTGFVVSDAEEMIDAVLKIDTIDRLTCRDYALLNFNAQKMVDGYEQIYKKILKKS